MKLTQQEFDAHNKKREREALKEFCNYTGFTIIEELDKNCQHDAVVMDEDHKRIGIVEVKGKNYNYGAHSFFEAEVAKIRYLLGHSARTRERSFLVGNLLDTTMYMEVIHEDYKQGFLHNDRSGQLGVAADNHRDPSYLIPRYAFTVIRGGSISIGPNEIMDEEGDVIPNPHAAREKAPRFYARRASQRTVTKNKTRQLSLFAQQ